MKIQLEIKQYSTKKLKEIIEKQANAYSEGFIDFAKNELIRRGENFIYNPDMLKQVKELGDADLKNVVEKERAIYHLEYLELAIEEYLNRGFKNETGYSDPSIEFSGEEIIEKRYPALRVYSAFFTLNGILSLLAIAFVIFSRDKIISSLAVPLAVVFILVGITYLSGAEAIKVFLAIEENTRRKSG